MVERVDLVHAYGVDPQRRWRSAATGASNLTHVSFGRLSDGRWYAHRTGRGASVEDVQQGACVFAATELGQTLALRLAYRWMREAGGRWWATPAAYDGRGEPTDGLPWVRRGGEWFLEG